MLKYYSLPFDDNTVQATNIIQKVYGLQASEWRVGRKKA